MGDICRDNARSMHPLEGSVQYRLYSMYASGRGHIASTALALCEMNGSMFRTALNVSCGGIMQGISRPHSDVIHAHLEDAVCHNSALAAYIMDIFHMGDVGHISLDTTANKRRAIRETREIYAMMRRLVHASHRRREVDFSALRIVLKSLRQHIRKY